ncbi:MAG: ABC transporter ATP-binding protein [Thermotogae bacterium]|nr:ABC transporter ATP-binding protein [Thermotogota bacterium]
MQFYEDEEKYASFDWQIFTRLLRYAKPFWKYLFLAFMLLLFITVLDLLPPYVSKIIIDQHLVLNNREYNGKKIITFKGEYYLVDPSKVHGGYEVLEKDGNIILKNLNGDTVILKEKLDSNILKKIRNNDKNKIVIFSLALVGILIVSFFLNYSQVFLLNLAGQKIIHNIRVELFSHILKLDLKFFESNPVGRLVTRVNNDTQNLNEMYTSVIVSVVKDVFTFVGICVAMFLLDRRLALISYATIPFIVISVVLFRIFQRKIYRVVRTRLARINAYISERISGIRIIQLFMQQKRTKKEFDEINKSYYNALIKRVIVFGLFRPLIDLIYFLGLSFLIWYGGRGIIRGQMEFGILYAFTSYLGMLFGPIRDFSEKFDIMQSAMASAEKIFKILDTKPRVKNKPKIYSFKPQGELRFENVWFAYNDEEWVLKDISFEVKKGEKVAIVGPTGAGKTSIIKLLTRFYDPQKGKILIDNVNIQDIPLEELRRHIGVVSQDVFLFSGTVKENIKLNENIPDEVIYEAARRAWVADFIKRLPRGFEEPVMERGAILSAGQRQLIALARVMVFDPKIVVLDEATANIDSETENLILKAMERIMEGRTTIVIAHRLSTIKNADKIIVIINGKVVEIGTHEELLMKNGVYKELYTIQFQLT